MKRLSLLLAPALLAAVVGCEAKSYEPPKDQIPTIPPGRSAGEGAGGAAAGDTGPAAAPKK